MQIIDFMLLFLKASSLKTEVTVFLKLRQLPKNLNLKSEQKLDKKTEKCVNYLYMVLVVIFCAHVVFISVQKEICISVNTIHKLGQENANGHRKQTTS